MSEYRGQNMVEQLDTDATQVNAVANDGGHAANPSDIRELMSFQGNVACCWSEQEQQNHYYLLEDLMPLKHEGGQSMIYFCRRCEDEEGNQPAGERLTAKVYVVDTIAKNIDAEEQKKKCQFLSSQAAKDHHVLSLVDYGYISEIFYCEIYPYCKDGDLRDQKFTMAQLIDTIIPQMNEALHTVHQANLIHRDMKPGNIYADDGKYYLADFGIASKSDKTLTSAARGTRNYMAPELLAGVVSPSADYYALGVTLLDLYKGSHVFEGLDHAKVYQAVAKLEIPLEVPPEDLPLLYLCGHLLLPQKQRMGYDGIKKFLENPAKLQKPTPYKEAETFRYEFCGHMYTDLDELSQAMAVNHQEAIERLFGGQIDRLFNRFSMDDLAAHAAFIVRDTDRKINQLKVDDEEGRALYEESALLLLLEKMSQKIWLAWKGEIYHGLGHLAECLAAADEKKTKDIMQLFAPAVLPNWIDRCDSKSHNGVISQREAIEKIAEIAENKTDLARQLMVFCFSANVDKRSYVFDNTLFVSMDFLFNHLSRKKMKFFQDVHALLSDVSFHAFYMVQSGKFVLTAEMEAAIARAREAMQQKEARQMPEHDVLRALLVMMEEGMTEKHKMREFYLRYGDRADILWLRDHLSYYVFLGAEAEKVSNALMKIKTHALSVGALMDELDQYMVYRDAFYELFEDNYFLAAMNLSSTEKPTGIISQNALAFFVYSFWGRPAPAGLARDLEDQAAL